MPETQVPMISSMICSMKGLLGQGDKIWTSQSSQYDIIYEYMEDILRTYNEPLELSLWTAFKNTK